MKNFDNMIQLVLVGLYSYITELASYTWQLPKLV